MGESDHRRKEDITTLKSGIAIVGVGVLVAVGVVSARDKQIKRSELPPAVEKTVAVQSGGAEVRGFSKEKEHGQTFYEAEMMVNGHSKDILIDDKGTVVEVEEEVAMDSLPAAVKSGLAAKAGRGQITKVESIIKKDKLVAYEAKVATNGKKSEVQVGPDGHPLDHEE